MKGKASDICPKCKYCEGMVEDSFYICGVTHSDGGLYHLMPAEDELYCTAYEEEINMSNLKVEGKVGEFCPKCKNCKSVMNEYDGKTASIRLTEVECEDPYDGMIKTLNVDSDICCSMFEPNSPCDKISLLQHELEMDRLRRTIHQLEKEKAAHMKGIERLKKSNNDLKESYNHLLETFKRENEAGSKIVEENVKLEREKSELIKASKRKDELIQSYSEKSKNYEQILIDISRFVPVDVTDFKDLPMIIEQMRKAGDKYDAVSESYDALSDQKYELQKANEKLEDKVHRLERMLHGEKERGRSIDTNFLMPLTRVLYPGEKVGKPYSEVLNDIKNLMVESEENETMYNDLKYWKERCHKAETDVTTLNSKVEVLDKRNTNQFVMIGEKDKEIEELKKKNRELQIRVNDLLFQEKLNKSAFGYDYEEEDGKLRVENERLRNENEYLRNRYPTYSAMKAEDKIEHMHEQAKKWKNKYKEAYDILQEFFGEDSNIMSIRYDLSGDQLTLKLLYNDSAYTKHNRLEKARERMRKLD